MRGPRGKRALLVIEVLVIVGLAEFAAVQIGVGAFARLFGNPSSRPSESSPCIPAGQAAPFVPASVRDLQDIPAGGTPDGSSMLVQRGFCSTQLATLVIDQIPAGSGAYRTSHIPAIAGMDLSHEEGVTLEADGLTIIGMTADSRGFRAARRSAVGKSDFQVVENDGFANIVGTPPQVLWAPSLSEDGLALYYSIVNDPDPDVNGIYESTRPTTDVPFPRGTRMPELVQTLAQFVNGVSTDHLRLFLELKDHVEGGYATVVLSRGAVGEPFRNPNAPGSPPRVPGLRTRPLGDGRHLVGSCAPFGGGCRGEDVCIWSAE